MHENRLWCWIVWRLYRRSIAFRIATIHAQENWRSEPGAVHGRRNDKKESI